jgi:hypothetical protein
LSGSGLAVTAPAASRSKRRHFGRLSIAAYLGLGIGGLMFVAVASILAITLYANWRNTTELLQDESRLLLGSLVEHTERFLDPDGFSGRLRGRPDRTQRARPAGPRSAAGDPAFRSRADTSGAHLVFFDPQGRKPSPHAMRMA